MQLRYTRLAAAMSALIGCAPAHGAPTAQKSIDPTSGNYVITYSSDDGTMRTAIFEPGNKVDAALGVALTLESNGSVTYAYLLKNGASSAQDVRRFGLPISNMNSSPPLIMTCNEAGISAEALRAAKKAAKQAVGSPSPWRPIVVATNPSVCRTDAAGTFRYVVDWSHFDETSLYKLRPGQAQAGFTLSSRDLPGIAVASVSGLYDLEGNQFPVDGSTNTALKDLYNELANDVSLFQVPRHSAVPTIRVADGTSDLALLQAIRGDVAGWPQQQVMETPLWQAIDRALEAAADALERGDAGRAVASLAQIKGQLRKAFPGLEGEAYVDDPRRLAAKVLDFNVDFVKQSVTRSPREPDTNSQ